LIWGRGGSLAPPSHTTPRPGNTARNAALVSRQYAEMSRIRIEGLLAAFPKLVGSGKQHTYVETENVRYVYQPIEVGVAGAGRVGGGTIAQRGAAGGAVLFAISAAGRTDHRFVRVQELDTALFTHS